MTITIGLAGDTMLGRSVGTRLESSDSVAALFAPEVVRVAHEADLLVLNLECCISARGEPWPDPFKPFFFRAPPRAIDALTLLGVDCVTLANNHALDYGAEALLDTIAYLDAAGIASVGAGADVTSARTPAVLARGENRVAILGFSDHPADFAAGHRQPGIAFGDLRGGLPGWVGTMIRSIEADIVLVSPHWGPNMITEPLDEIRLGAGQLIDAGATLVVGHSAHVFHGVEGRIVYDLGDFIDDYRIDPRLRNDLGLLVLATLDGSRLAKIEAVPLKLDFCHTRLATGDDFDWATQRFRDACARLGTAVEVEHNRLVVDVGATAVHPDPVGRIKG